MTMSEIDNLNDEFSLQHDENYLHFENGDGNIPVLNIKNRHARARLSLQGAHLFSWIPEGEEEVIWLSDNAEFAEGKSLRGGIPVCWPWFGAHQTNTDYPAHGFARTSPWQVICTEDLDDERTRITLINNPLPENRHMWPPLTSLQLQVTIGRKLEMELITHNDSKEPITIGQALHTYFRVGDISSVALFGLDNTWYLDKLDDYKRKLQLGTVTIESEIDRIYLDTIAECVIEDRSLDRNIIINKCGSHSTVVWNPWHDSSIRMGDMGEDGYRKMLCVESSNAADDVVTIRPGKSHHLWVQFEVQPRNR
jgi:glucose-6-phosphate 1-epimerase